jgi:Transposase protein
MLANVTANMAFLKADQRKALDMKTEAKTKGGIVWSTATIRTAFQIRFLTGVHGYHFVRGLGYPLPSYRTLCDRVQHAEFHPDIQYDIVSWLSDKIEGMRDQEKDVVLMLDETQVSAQLEYDKGLNRFWGLVTNDVLLQTASSSVPLASHALVYMIRGITSNWKQVVAYYLTGASVSGDVLWKMIKNLFIYWEIKELMLGLSCRIWEQQIKGYGKLQVLQ